MLLANASSIDRLQPILSGLGFETGATPADPTTRAALRIPPDYRDVAIVRGAGALRALIATAPRSLGIREATSRVAGRLAASAPHILWLLVVTDPECEALAFATWTPECRPPSVAALIVDRGRVVDSDGETLVALAAARDDLDILTHARWLEILGRESVTRCFYRTLESVVRELAASLPHRGTADERTELALLCVSRLLFLSFLEAKGWLDGDRAFLARTFDECVASGGGYHRRLLLPLLHGTLNARYSARAPVARAFGRVPFLNGGLFARTPLERRLGRMNFPDAQVGRLFGDLLGRYRFTAREDSGEWSEAAIDPEMLGKAFESIMSSGERRGSGAYFTPHSLVHRVTTGALARYLADAGVSESASTSLLQGTSPDAVPSMLRERLARIRVLDPACGSGAFLVHTLERLAGMHVALGDARDLVDIRRDVLTRSIFGVDRNPFAVWLCELRLWLSMVIESDREDPLGVPPLPNLDHHIRVGDALAGDSLAPLSPLATRGVTIAPARRSATAITALRSRYVRASGPRKQSLARALDRAERARALAIIDAALATNAIRRRDLLAAVRSRDLFGERRRAIAAETAALASLRAAARELRVARRSVVQGVLPFSFATHFADSAAAGGFDVIVGNPPWVRIHRIPATSRALLRARFAVFHEPGWTRGADLAHAGAGFAAQVDLAALFVERSLELLRPCGTFSLLLPSKLWRSLAGGSLRRLLGTHATLLSIDDLSESPQAFDAAVYPSIVVAARGRPMLPEADAPGPGSPASFAATRPTPIAATLTRRSTSVQWSIDPSRLSFDGDPASPWLLLPPDMRDAFDRLTAAGTPLAESVFGRPHLGVKSGCNGAFIVSAAGARRTDDAVVDIEAPGRRGRIERELLRPLIRGETLKPWVAASIEHIVWTHGAGDSALDVLPAHARHWLLPWRRRLMARTDRHGRGQWWSLFRTESARYDRPRVVWADIGRTPRAAVIEAGDPTVPLNSCYVVRSPDLAAAHALTALLNGPLVAAWLGALAEPARGGFHRYLGWTMALVPLPRDWARAVELLAPIGARAGLGETVTMTELLDAAMRSYALDIDDVAPLLAWAAR